MMSYKNGLALIMAMVTLLSWQTSETVGQFQERGYLNVGIKNLSFANIRATASDPSGNILMKFDSIQRNQESTFQSLLPGDIITTYTGNGNYKKTVGNQSRTYIYNGNTLVLQNGNGIGNNPGGNGGRRQGMSSITFFNQTNQPVDIAASGPSQTNGNVVLGGGVRGESIKVGQQQLNLRTGASLTVKANNQDYRTTVLQDGIVIISYQGVTYNGQPMTAGIGGGMNGGGNGGGFGGGFGGGNGGGFGGGFGGGGGNTAPRLGFQSQLTNGGLQITSVESGSMAQRMGLEQGDLITAVNGTMIRSQQNYENALMQASLKGSVKLLTRIRGTNRTLPLYMELSGQNDPIVVGVPVSGLKAQPSRSLPNQQADQGLLGSGQ